MEDIDLGRGTLTVHRGKGARGRTVPLGGRASAPLRSYLDIVRPLLELDASEHALFLSGYGARIDPHYLGNWVKKTMREAGIDKPVSRHLLRHSCATHMHDNGTEIGSIQALLGHARLDTTQIYTKVSIAKLQDVHARTHPHGREPGGDKPGRKE